MKKSISVKEMYTMLGISKVSGYELLKQGYFETIFIAHHTRILVDSFENWYAHQNYYHKVNGQPPGQALIEEYYTEQELQKILGLSRSTVYELVRKGLFNTVPVERKKYLIEKVSFEDWYSSQFRYRKVNGDHPGSKYPPSYSATEVRKILGLKKRDQVYALLKKNGIKWFMVDGTVRVEKESFEKWKP